MLDPLWLLLLLPLAAASGWYAGRRDSGRTSEQSVFHLPSAYFKGLNFLLNEQPDKAIEVFIKVLEVDSETVEMHLTLGNLFRRRGEIERATRIHQNLIARPNLSKNQRFHALYELAQDYFKAGLFDRAESLFQELADVPTYGVQALKYLSQLYEQEKEWKNAISVLRRLSNISGKDGSQVIAQYYCELAQIEFDKGRLNEAHNLINQALVEDSNCVRATIQLGDVEYRNGDHAGAISTWSKVEQQDSRFLDEVVDKIVDAFHELRDEDGLQRFLGEALARQNGRRLLLARVDEIVRTDGRAAAVSFLTDWLQDNPTVYGLRRLLELRTADSSDDLTAITALLVSMIDPEEAYRCRQCGFKGRSLHWQCPGCKGWNTNEPVGETQLLHQTN